MLFFCKMLFFCESKFASSWILTDVKFFYLTLWRFYDVSFKSCFLLMMSHLHCIIFSEKELFSLVSDFIILNLDISKS